MIGVLLASLAAAQSQPPTIPEVATDLFRPALGSQGLATEPARVHEGAIAGLHVTGAGPMLAVLADGEPTFLVHEVVGMHLGARFGIGPVQLGVDAPAYLVARTEGSRALLGDPSLMVKVAAGGQSWGVGAMGRLGTSLGASARGLGYPGAFGELGVLGEGHAGRLSVAGNVGVRFVPPQDLNDLVLDDVGFGRLAVSVGVSDMVRPYVEAFGQAPITSRPIQATMPLEGLAGLALHCAPGTLQVGVGRGLTSAVGTPGWRLVLGLTWAAPGVGDTQRPWNCRPKKPSTT